MLTEPTLVRVDEDDSAGAPGLRGCVLRAS